VLIDLKAKYYWINRFDYTK